MALLDLSVPFVVETFPTSTTTFSSSTERYRVQAIASCAHGEVYFGRGALVCKLGLDGVEEVYAGRIVGQEEMKDGHRLDEATFKARTLYHQES
jgi:hypothetical protein